MSWASTPDLTLDSASISNACARIRIALTLKQLPCNVITTNLSQGDQHDPSFAALNPSKAIPVLIHQHDGSGRKTVIGQSIAALQYLDEAFPHPKPLLPPDPEPRARIRTLAAALASDTRPLLTHRVSKAIREIFRASAADPADGSWDKYWAPEGPRV